MAKHPIDLLSALAVDPHLISVMVVEHQRPG
jgi:hypothetical protein